VTCFHLPGLLFDPRQEENRKFFGTGVYLGVMTFVSACRMAVDSNCYRARTRNVARRNGNQNKANTYAKTPLESVLHELLTKKI
jgi:hypothetical protein